MLFRTASLAWRSISRNFSYISTVSLTSFKILFKLLLTTYSWHVDFWFIGFLCVSYFCYLHLYKLYPSSFNVVWLMLEYIYIYIYMLVEKEITLKLNSKQGSGQSLLTNKPRQSASKIEIRFTGGLEKQQSLYQERVLI